MDETGCLLFSICPDSGACVRHWNSLIDYILGDKDVFYDG